MGGGIPLGNTVSKKTILSLYDAQNVDVLLPSQNTEDTYGIIAPSAAQRWIWRYSMTREEAIRILDPETTGEALAEIEYYNGFSGNTAAVQAVSDACILAISALREQEERRWIPVTERFPDKPMECLVYNKRGEGGDYDIAYYGQGSYLRYSDSTYWMPLPKPPKGE